MPSEIEKLKDSLIVRKPILFIGAGFSRGALCKGQELPIGEELRMEIFDIFYKAKSISDEEKKEVEEMSLPELCKVIQREGRGADLKKYLIDRFQNAVPNPDNSFHDLLCDYYWDKIYTLNIDDLVENIYSANHIEFVVQNEKTQKPYADKRQIIKLHGCVNNSEEGFVFSEDEYISSIANEDYRLKEFSQDCFSNDIIFLGTEFNETDISVLIEKNKRAGFVKRNSFFFVSPKISYKLKTLIESNEKFHYIQYSTEEFLRFCSTLKKAEKSIEDQTRILEQYGNFQDIEKYSIVPITYESKLYYGNKVTYYDIFDEWDIVYSKTATVVNKVLKNNKNVGYIIALFGKAFSGKSVVATRLLIELYNNGYSAYSYNCDGENELFAINEYFKKCKEIKKIAVLIDDAAYLYGSIAKLLNNLPEHIQSIVFILVSNKRKHLSQKHELVGLYGCEWELKDDFDDKLPRKIYRKLADKERLGPLSALTQMQAIEKIKSSKQLVEFFYDYTHGTGFSNYFNKKLRELLSSSSKESVEIIKFLCVLSKMGIHNVNQTLVRLIYGNIDTEELSDVVIGLDLTGSITLRCADSYDNYLFELTSSERIHFVYNALVKISNMFREDANNRWKNIYEQLLKSRDLIYNLRIDIKDVKDLFTKLERYYSHTSYYWMQRGLLKQLCKEYDEADTFLNQALAIRPNSYQIRHALAKNKLEKAVYICGNGFANEGDILYEKGTGELLALLESPRFSNNIGHSVHSYISMTLKYYKGRKKIIEKDRILEMYKYLVLSSKQSYDKWMKRCRDDLFNYCKLNYTEYMALFDIAAFDKFKVENRMSLIS